jgi:hypothetical protein
MPKHIYLIFLTTFLLGCVAGVVILLQTKTGGSEIEDSTPKKMEGFTISARMYGGCMRVGCPSYHIDTRSTYTYIFNNQEREEQRIEDALTQKQAEALDTLVRQTDFTGVKATSYEEACPVTYDGVAYTYDIESAGGRYSFDSCVENLEQYELFIQLSNYFDAFAHIHNPE